MIMDCNLKTWILGAKIGEGATSLAYKARSSTQNDMILKITSLDEDEGVSRDTFEVSMIMMKRFSDLGVSPELKDWWFCETDHAVSVSDYAGITLKQFLEEEPSSSDKMTVAEGIVKMVNKIHKQGWFHGDVSTSNICLLINGVGGEQVKLSTGNFRLYLIDTENSGDLELDHGALDRELGKIRGMFIFDMGIS